MSLLAVGAQAVVAFNLLCSGTLTHGKLLSFKETEQNAVPFKTELRVDLAKMRWCEGACASTKPIVSVSETKIVFELEDDNGFDTIHYVNRESGTYGYRVRDMNQSYLLVMRTGSCERAPFTGLPTRKF